MPRDRRLAWDGCLNVRDLGGHPTEDGRETRFGAVVRADSRARLSDAGWEALVSYGVSRIVDLRRDDERAADPPDRLEVDVVHVSLMAAIERPDAWARVKERAAAAPDVSSSYALLYSAALDQCRTAVATALAAVGEAPPGTVLVHCTAGKDRTGLLAALMLRLCGVSVDAVDADYALSERSLRAARSAWIDAAIEAAERAERLASTDAPAGAMARVLERLEARHGTVAAYLAGAGLSGGALERLRARLLG